MSMRVESSAFATASGVSMLSALTGRLGVVVSSNLRGLEGF